MDRRSGQPTEQCVNQFQPVLFSELILHYKLSDPAESPSNLFLVMSRKKSKKQLPTKPDTPSARSEGSSEAQQVESDLAVEELRKTRLEADTLQEKLRVSRGWVSWLGVVTSFTPLATAVLAIAGFLFGVEQYLAQRRTQSQSEERIAKQAFETKEKEFKKVFWEQQMALYVQVTHEAAAVASSKDSATAENLHRVLMPYLHGDLVVVADTDVIKAAIAYEDAYRSYIQDETRQGDLLSAARTLARTCRNSLIKTFNTNLGELKDYHAP